MKTVMHGWITVPRFLLRIIILDEMIDMTLAGLDMVTIGHIPVTNGRYTY